MHWITTTGEGSFTSAGTRGTAMEMEGNAFCYDTDQVLALGGAATFSGQTASDHPSTNEAYEINFSSGTPQVTGRSARGVAFENARPQFL